MSVKLTIATLFVVLGASAQPALAAKPAEAAAKRASDAHEAWCSDASAGRATRHAQALVELAPILAEVSRVFEESGEPYLLFWRGMLNRCLSQEEQAEDDLRAFVSFAGASELYANQVQRAVALLRRSAAPSTSSGSRPSPTVGGVILGSGLAAGSAALGGLAGWQGGLASEGQARFYEGQRPWADLSATADEADEHVRFSGGLVAGAVGVGVASAVTFVVVAARGAAPPVAVVPLLDGTTTGLALTGKW